MSARVCPCGCGGSLDGARKGAIWKDGDSCRKRAERRGVPVTRVQAAKRAANADRERTPRRGGPRGIALPHRRTVEKYASDYQFAFGCAGPSESRVSREYLEGVDG
jgi:hypothetical protein